MGDEFQGVPANEWADYRDEMRVLRNLAVILAILIILIVWTLTEKGVIASPLDLFRTAGPASG